MIYPLIVYLFYKSHEGTYLRIICVFADMDDV